MKKARPCSQRGQAASVESTFSQAAEPPSTSSTWEGGGGIAPGLHQTDARNSCEQLVGFFFPLRADLVTHLLQLRVGLVLDPLGYVVDVGAGGAGEPEAAGTFLYPQDVGARGAKHEHGEARLAAPFTVDSLFS